VATRQASPTAFISEALPASRQDPAEGAEHEHARRACCRPQPKAGSLSTTRPPFSVVGGATASSEGTRPVCRLPLTALLPSTRGYHPWRPAAVLQYGKDAGATFVASGTFKEHLVGRQSESQDSLPISLGFRRFALISCTIRYNSPDAKKSIAMPDNRPWHHTTRALIVVRISEAGQRHPRG